MIQSPFVASRRLAKMSELCYGTVVLTGDFRITWWVKQSIKQVLGDGEMVSQLILVQLF